MFHIWSCQQASADHIFDTYYGTIKAGYQIYSDRNIMADDETHIENSVQPVRIERNMGFLGASIILVRGIDEYKTREVWNKHTGTLDSESCYQEDE
jgi:hypothetical protein